MKQPPDKIQQAILDFERRKLITSAFLVPILIGIFFISVYLFKELSLGLSAYFVAAIASIIIIFPVRQLLFNIAFDRSRRKFYGDDIHNFLKDSDLAEEYYSKPTESVTKSFELIIMEKPDVSVGTFKEVPIYEWIDVKDINGNPVRFHFEGVINDLDSVVMKTGQLIIPPGLLYHCSSSTPLQCIAT